MHKITTYKELVEEEKRLKTILASQKITLMQEWETTKMQLKPFEKTIDFVSNVTTKNQRNPLLNMGIDLGVDVLLRHGLLGKAGFLTKLLVPMVVRNYSSNILSNSNGTSQNIFSRVKNFFRKKEPASRQPA